MSFTSYSFVIFTAGIIFIFGVLFVRKVHKNTHDRREMRKILLKRIETLPLPKMLQALGISFTDYFYKESVDAIDKSISNCEKCSSTESCTEKLKFPELNPGDIEFCPSQQYLKKLSRENRIKG